MGRLEDELRTLGNDASCVARKLRKAHVAGKVDTCFDDPVSRWLEKRGWYMCALGGDEWVAYCGEHMSFEAWDACAPVGPVWEFLRRFDAGMYPDLVEGSDGPG